ncbi:MAG: ANTAR domain-containing protein [Spirochaetales bacterium]
MERALIVSNSANTTEFVTELLQTAGIEHISSVPTATLARRLSIDVEYDLYIIDSPLVDESGEEIAEYLAEKNTCQVLMLIQSEYFDEISEKTELFGVIGVPKPLERITLWTSVKASLALFKKMTVMQKQNSALQDKIEEIRIVDRAKCILIADYSFSEEEAHKFIEQQAMKTRKSRKAIAEELIKAKVTGGIR